MLVFNITMVLLMAVTNVPYTSIILLYIGMGITSCINEKNSIQNQNLYKNIKDFKRRV